MSHGNWQPIAGAPAEGTFQLAAWHDQLGGSGGWVTGEAYRDRKAPGKFWWANTDYGDYHAEDLLSAGLVPVFWQPMAPPPSQPNKPEVQS